MSAKSVSRHQSTILLQRARNGSSEAIDAILGQVGGRLLALIRLRLGKPLRAHLESRDVLQATMLKAFQRFDQFEGAGGKSFVGWLAAIAQNEIRDQVDYHHRDKRDAALNVALEDNQLAAHVRSQVSLIQLERDAKHLEEALERLDEAYREVIILRKLEELSFGEIAEKMGRSSEACRKLLARAMTALSQAMYVLRHPSAPER